jgi:general stress protein 26
VAGLLAVAAGLVLRSSGLRVLSAVLVLRGAAGVVVSGFGWGDAPRAFRRLDLAVYSPLCLTLAAAIHPATPSAAGSARALVARSSRRVGLALTRVTDDRVLRAARKTMARKTYCVLVTDGPDGPGARVVQPHAPDTDLTVHLGTAAGSRKAGDVARTGSAVLVYQDDARAACVVLHCDAEVADLEPAGRERWFMTAWLAFWPRGSTDEDFVVIRCRPHTIEVWDALRGITPAPYGLASARLVRTPSGWAAAEDDRAQRPADGGVPGAGDARVRRTAVRSRPQPAERG